MDNGKMPERIVIYTSDIKNIFGVHTRTAQRRMKELRQYADRQKREFVTIVEFCECFKMPEELIRPFLKR